MFLIGVNVGFINIEGPPPRGWPLYIFIDVVLKFKLGI